MTKNTNGNTIFFLYFVNISNFDINFISLKSSSLAKFLSIFLIAAVVLATKFSEMDPFLNDVVFF